MRPTRALTGDSSKDEIVKQLKACKRAWIAVAWATENVVFRELMKQGEKMACVVIGTHGSLTAPTCIEWLANKNWAHFRSAKGPLFHPKLYLFEHDDRFTTIVGSHNLTQGAFFSNEELSLVSEFEKSAPVVQALRDYVDHAANGPCITPTMAFMDRYKARNRAAQRLRKNVEDLVVEETDQATEAARMSAPIHMEWDEWLRQIDAKDEHGRRRRLQTLGSIQKLLKRPGGFLHLPLRERRRVAGLSMERTKTDDDVDWNYFGEMTTLRRFDKPYSLLVEKEPPTELANALNLLPNELQPTRDDWLAYWNAVNNPSGVEGSIGLSAATRLAAVKRPDFFVPVTEANRGRLAELLNVPRNALTSASDYWDVVIKTILLTPWWTSDRPANDIDARTWDARAAMLDALVYEKTSSRVRKSRQGNLN